MGRFSLDKYESMKPLFVQGLDISKTVDVLADAERQINDSFTALKKVAALPGIDVEKRDAIFNESWKPVEIAAAGILNPLDKARVAKRAAMDYVNNTQNEAILRSVSQQGEYDGLLSDRVKKADIQEDDALIGSKASLLLHNYKGGTDPENGNYFVNSQLAIPNLVDKQGIISKIKTPGSGYSIDNQWVADYDAATGYVRTVSRKTGEEKWLNGEQVGNLLYANNEGGIKDRDIWDAKKEIAIDLFNTGRYNDLAEAFVAVNQDSTGVFENRLLNKVEEKRARFIRELKLQTDYKKTEGGSKEHINPANLGGGAEVSSQELVMDTKSDVRTVDKFDKNLEALDVDSLVQEYEESQKSEFKSMNYNPEGAWDMYLDSERNSLDSEKELRKRKNELGALITNLKRGKMETLNKYGFNAEEWRQLSPSEQNNKIKALLKQRKNVSNTVGILEKNNNEVYATTLENPEYILYYDHDSKKWKEGNKQNIVDKYFDPSGIFDSVSEKDAQEFKANSGHKSENSSKEIKSWDEYRQHILASKITPELAIDYSGQTPKVYYQYTHGNNNSGIRVPVSNITNSIVAPLSSAYQEFNNPSGKKVILPNVEILDNGGNYRRLENLSVKWVNGDFKVMVNDQPTGLTLENLGIGMISKHVNTKNTTANVAKTKANQERPN